MFVPDTCAFDCVCMPRVYVCAHIFIYVKFVDHNISCIMFALSIYFYFIIYMPVVFTYIHVRTYIHLLQFSFSNMKNFLLLFFFLSCILLLFSSKERNSQVFLMLYASYSSWNYIRAD